MLDQAVRRHLSNIVEIGHGTVPFSLMLGGFTLLFAVLFIVGSVRRRRSAVGSVAILLLVGVGTWGLLFGIWWYFQHMPPLSFTP